jgi:hypothetical protein
MTWASTSSREAAPLSNPKDAEYFREVRKLKLNHAKVAAFGMTPPARGLLR